MALMRAMMLANAGMALADTIANDGEKANPNAACGMATAVANNTNHGRTAEYVALAK